jgi:hypothetical protein
MANNEEVYLELLPEVDQWFPSPCGVNIMANNAATLKAIYYAVFKVRFYSSLNIRLQTNPKTNWKLKIVFKTAIPIK